MAVNHRLLLLKMRKFCKRMHPYLYAHWKPLAFRGDSCEL